MSELGKQNKGFLPDKMGILVLAAGYSARFPGDKRRAQIGDGSSLLELTVSNLLDSGLPLRLCLRDEPGDRSWEDRVPSSVTPIYCDRSREGMGATLAQGIAACEDWSVTFVTLGDMPSISPSTIRRLSTIAGEEWIVAPSFRERLGHPVAFGRRFYGELRNLSGDTGARSVVNRHETELQVLEVDDPGVHFDVDVPEALAKLR